MPWNEPGKDGGRDPWSDNRGRGGGGNAPDLDEVMRKLGDRFGGLFGGGGGRKASAGLSLILIVVLVVWLASGFYIVREGERGVVLRFAAFASITAPGPHWHLPYPIETVEIVDVDSVRSIQHRARMLTQDENIVDVEISVQYRVVDAADYSFNVRDPDFTLRQAMESSVRERVGKSTMDFILGEGRSEVVASTRELLQQALDAYGAGLIVTTVNLQQAQPPEPVQNAFADAIRAREDEQRFRNEAEAYANSVLPQARGEAARIGQEAEAYRDQVVARAEGDASRFQQLLTEYERAPGVTRERLYLEAVEAVLGSTNKILVDVKDGNNLLYLPLDKLIRDGGVTTGGGTTAMPSSATQRPSDAAARPDPRSREVR